MLLALGPAPSLSPSETSSSCRQVLPTTRLEQSSPFLAIPSELIHEVFIHLNYQALAYVRLVCRIFYEVTLSRQFSYARIQQLCSRSGATNPEISLEDSSVRELTKWLLRRLRVRDEWASRHPLQFRIRLMNGGTSFVQTVAVPGGRWMLGLDFSGNMKVMDLDRIHLRPRILFRTSRPHDYPLSKVQACFDEFYIGRSFRVAVYNLDCLPNMATSVHIYRVYTAGSGPLVSLNATPIMITPESHRQGPRMSFCFDQKYILQCGLLTDDPGGEGLFTMRVELRRYTEPQSVCEVRTHLLHDTGLIKAVLLPLDRAAVFSPDSIQVFAITQPDEGILALTPLHNLATQDLGTLSTPFHGHSSVYFVAYNEELKKITFSHDPTVPPEVATLGEIKFSRRYRESCMTFGPSTGLLLASNTELKIATYSLDDTVKFAIKRYVRSSHSLWEIEGIAAFDEPSGRIVLQCNGNDFLILDLT